MAKDYLHLDGLFKFDGCIEGYRRDCSGEEKPQCLRSEVLSRVFLLAQAAIVAVTHTISQVLRGLSFIIAGILTLDGDRVIFGFKDFVSVIAQAIALPILGIVATVSPLHARKLIHWFAQKSNPNLRCRRLNSDSYQKGLQNFRNILMPFQFINITQPPSKIAKVVTCLFAPPQSILMSIQNLARSILTFDCDWKVIALPVYLIVTPFVTAINYDDNTYVSAQQVSGFKEQLFTV